MSSVVTFWCCHRPLVRKGNVVTMSEICIYIYIELTWIHYVLWHFITLSFWGASLGGFNFPRWPVQNLQKCFTLAVHFVYSTVWNIRWDDLFVDLQFPKCLEKHGQEIELWFMSILRQWNTYCFQGSSSPEALHSRGESPFCYDFLKNCKSLQSLLQDVLIVYRYTFYKYGFQQTTWFNLKKTWQIWLDMTQWQIQDFVNR